jgi:cytochrome c oxidase subunit 1
MSGLRVDDKEMLLTTVVAARPDLREPVPEPSIWPFISALAVTVMFVGSIFSAWAVPFGLLPIGIALTCWFWPKQLEPTAEPVIE